MSDIAKSETYIHTYVHTYIYTHITWIHKCVTKRIGCGTSHTYTNIYNFYSVKYYQHFKKQYYRSSLHIQNSSSGEMSVYLSIFLMLI